MPTFDDLVTRAAALGYPIAENEFNVTKQKPAPELPFICHQHTERFTGPDASVRIKTTDGSFELYTDRRLSEDDKQIIAEFQKRVLFDVEYVKMQNFIRDENMTQTAFEFSIVEKTRL